VKRRTVLFTALILLGTVTATVLGPFGNPPSSVTIPAAVSASSDGGPTSATFARMGGLTLPPREVDFASAVIDSAGGFAYFGTLTSPGVVVKVDLATFAVVGSLTLASGEDHLTSAVIDPAGGFAYFGTDTSPGIVVKVDLATFTRVGSLTLASGEDRLTSAAIAPRDAFFGTDTAPGIVVQVHLSDFTRVGSLTLASGEDRLTSAVIDPRSGGGVYFGTDTGGVVKVGSGPVRIAGLDLFFGACCVTSAVIDSAHGFAFFGTDTSPGRVVEVKLSDFTRVDILTLPSGEDHLTSAVIDSVDTAHPAYFGTDTGRVVKVELTDGVDLKGNPAKVLTRVGGLTLPSGEDHLTSAVIDSAGGFAYFGTLTSPGVVVKINVRILDTTPPTIAIPQPIVVEATGPNGAVVTYTATATDDVDGTITPTCSPASGSTFPLGTTTVMCTATDSSGNSNSASFTVTVRDTTSPSIVAPADITAEATSSAGAVVSYPAPTVSDAVDSNPTVVCSPASGTTFPIGSTMVTCTATDFSGNSVSATFHVNVFDFTISFTPQDRTVLRGASTAYVVNVRLVSGSAGAPSTVSLSIAGLPADAMISGFPSSVALPGTITLNVRTGPISLGDFTLTVTGQPGPRSGSGGLQIYDFTMASSPDLVYTNPGGTAIFTETLTLASGSTTNGLPAVQLSVDGVPPGASSAFSPASITPSALGALSTLSIVTTSGPSGTAVGSYRITVTGTDTRNPEGGARNTPHQTLVVLPTSAVTDSALCRFDVDSTQPGDQFRLIFIQDIGSTFILRASNPGQFYDNLFAVVPPGPPGSSDPIPVTLSVQIPYPFVTQGTAPAHIWGDVAPSSGCFVPANERTGLTATPASISLASYSPQAAGASTMMTISGSVPSLGGLVYVTIHLDYGLKGSAGYGKNANNDAIDPVTSAELIQNLGTYTFVVSGAVTDSKDIQNENVFKRNPGIGGLVLHADGSPMPGMRVEMYDSKGTLLAVVTTDKDGWYMWAYKYTGKPATFTVKVPALKLQASVTLNANGFAVVSFNEDGTVTVYTRKT